MGDCCDTQEHKMAAFAGAHGETVARNIIKELMGCSPTPYKRVKLELIINVHESLYYSLVAICWYVGTIRQQWRSWDVQWLPHPQLYRNQCCNEYFHTI